MGEGEIASMIRVEFEQHERQLLSVVLFQFRRDMGSVHADHLPTQDLHNAMLLQDRVDAMQRALGVTDPWPPLVHLIGEGAKTVELSEDQRRSALRALSNFHFSLKKSDEAQAFRRRADDIVVKLGGDPERGGLWET